MSDQDVLELFHPCLADWFRRRVGAPTEVQRLAWPVIAGGAHALVSAPTGSGKTLTAFLWSLDRLFRESLVDGAADPPQPTAFPAARPDGVRILYVSPLKALGSDIRANLTGPLEELRQAFRAAGLRAGPVSVATRSGDTPAGERRGMIRRPPDILITTPESLNLMLTAPRSREVLRTVDTLILDEIHAVVESKRGVHLMTAVERLALLSGEFQRIALSATVRPLDLVAEFVGGLRPEQRGDRAGTGADEKAAAGVPEKLRPRPVRIVEAPRAKQYRISVHFPIRDMDAPVDLRGPPPAQRAAQGAAQANPDDESETAEPNVWETIAAELVARIRSARSSLVFCNNRRLSEQLTRMLNEDLPGRVYAHHGSLSRELRRVVEYRLKKGELSAVVATSSLELGIDVGSLDQVLLVETPRSIASAIQRVGRAGHGVGEVSTGRLYPSHGRDLLEAAVVGQAIREGAIEPIRPVAGALDVLAQVALAMLGVENWPADELFAFFKTCYSYRELTRRRFDLVIDMLRGRYERTRVRELKARIAVDEVDGRKILRARPGALQLIYSSGGTIPDRGYFDLRTGESRARIGSLDEEFVWERSIGDAFAFGAGVWRITAITHNDVEVVPAGETADLLPFWRAEALNRSYFLSERIGALLERAEGLGLGPEFVDELVGVYELDRAAAAALADWLRRQQEATGKLPTRRRVIVERFRHPDAVAQGMQMLVHTNWGGRVNRPLALALTAACQERFGGLPEYFANDDCVNLLLPEDVSLREILDEVSVERIEELLRRRLEATGFFGARFRENAGRALLLPRSGFKQRTPLWLNRRRSKKLLEDVQAYDDFPLVVETWRTCLADEFDLEHLRELYRALADGEIELHETRTTTPSPFAAGVIWRQVNEFMYADDRPTAGAGMSLSDELFREMVSGARLRPRLPERVIAEFLGRVQRLAPGYAPTTGQELYDWLGERVALPRPEWEALAAAVERDAGRPARDLLEEAGTLAKLIWLAGAGANPADDLLVSKARLNEVRSVRAADASSPASVRAFDGGALKAADQVSYDESGRPDGGEPVALAREWLQFYGPVPLDYGATLTGDQASWRATVFELIEAGGLIRDVFRETVPGATGGESGVQEICDAENLEILLRMARRRARPAVRARPIDELLWFLACWQGLVQPGEGIEAAQAVLESLFGFVAPAGAWESDILPARIGDYRPQLMDGLLAESELVWYGAGREKIAFAFPEDLRLFRRAEQEVVDPGASPLPEPGGRFDFFELDRRENESQAELARRLWEAVWSGAVSNTGLAALRKGLAAKFRLEEVGRGRGRWRSSRPVPGLWFGLPAPEAAADALGEEEDRKQKARQLLARYGIVFRELLAQEAPALRWSEVFRALRIMELSGEIVAGHFFEGPTGPQFMKPGALRLFRDLPPPRLGWISAVDPISPCGLNLPGWSQALPRRLPGNHLVFYGGRLVLVSENRGRRLDFRVPPDDPLAAEAIGFFERRLRRPDGSTRSIGVETVNGAPAADSPYAPLLRAGGFRKEMKKLILDRIYEKRNFVDST